MEHRLVGVISEIPTRLRDRRARETQRTAAEPKSLARPQKTLKNAIHCTGVGLHSGRRISMTLIPAPVGTGILFRRTDVPVESADIPARWDSVVNTQLCTVIGNQAGVTVGTIEHLMAALAGCEIDNLIVELDAAEVPVMDGSAAPFVFLVECAGVVEQDAPRQVVRVLREVRVEDKGRVATLSPATGFSVSFDIDFGDNAVASQSLGLEMVPGAFKADVCRARTFGFLEDVAKMHAAGLAKGGSLENAVVVSGDKILNEGGLRYDDEFVRHKILDSIGDLYTAGHAIEGHFHGVKAGHEMNNKVLRALFADPANWCLVDVDADTPAEAPVAVPA